ncbi:S-layer homology domain-containing protein [Neomoorella carbonis]|uniref:S-layer homology domain-containing protein n=1 Tax=Neomoorella carbonis TaxID=3062783 RepID=UPI00325004E6
MGRSKKIGKRLTYFLTFLMVLNMFLPVAPAWAGEGAGSPANYPVQFLYNEYIQKGVQNADQGVGSYTFYILSQAGVDGSTWVYNGQNLKEAVIDAVYRDIKNPPSAKTLAQDLVAARVLGREDLVNRLAQILQSRQTGSGFDSGDFSLFSNIPAFELLGRANLLSVIDKTYAKEYILSTKNTTVGEATYGSWGYTYQNIYYPDFMATAQAVRALYFLDPSKEDVSVQAAIYNGLEWMQQQQQPDGSFVVGWDDPLLDTSEVILTLTTLGIDPASWKNQGKSAVDYLWNNAVNPDGSLGAFKNAMDATWALGAYNSLGITPTIWRFYLDPSSATLTNIGDHKQFRAVWQDVYGKTVDVTQYAQWSVANDSLASVDATVYGLVTALNTGQTVVKAIYNGLTATAILNITLPTSSTPDRDYCIVDIAVVGMNGELLYGPGSVMVSKNGRWGLTALGALDATGLPYVDDNGFVKSIAGQANSGMNGWMYQVNGSVPMVSASQKTIQDGDQIIWWYSTDWSSPGPVWESLVKSSTSASTAMTVPADLKEQNKKLPVALQAPEVAVDALAKINQLLELTEGTFQIAPLNEVKKAVVVTGGEKAMSRAETAALRKELAQNQIDLAQKVTASAGAIITDAKEEIALSIPAGALQNDLEITIKKATVVASAGNTGGNAAQAPPPAGYQQISAIYNFGPDGTTFNIPVTLNLKIALPPLAKPENLALAWYDKTKGQWVAIPVVVDMSKGLILARVNHFSDYAVFAKEARKSFEDVTNNSFGWAKDTIETLAGAGIVAGVDSSHFEPGRAVTRAEFASLLVKALGLGAKEGTKNPFKDVKGDAWYAGAVTAAAGNGLVKGYEDGTFRPENAITREELVAMLVRAMNLPASEEKLAFKDNDKVSAWARKSVAVAAAHGLVKGFEDGTFRPGDTASRAECAVMIYRMLVAE